MKYSGKEHAALEVIHYLSHMGEVMCSNEELADYLGYSKSYMEKVTKSLKWAGILYIRRGFNGGILLNKGLSEISLVDVIDAMAETNDEPKFDKKLRKLLSGIKLSHLL